MSVKIQLRNKENWSKQMRVSYILVLLMISTSLLYSQGSFRLEWEIEDDIDISNAIVDNNGNTIVVGRARKIEQNNDGDGYIFKMDTIGEYSFYRYPGAMDSTLTFRAVEQVSNGNYLVVGTYGLTDIQTPNHILMSFVFSPELILLNERKFTLPEEYKMISQFRGLVEDDGNVLFAASARSKYQPGTKMDDLALLRFSPDGDTIETRFLHYQHNVMVYDMDKIPDSPNYLLLQTPTEPWGQFECYILKPDLSKDTSVYWYDYDIYLEYANTNDYWFPDKSFLMGSLMWSDSKTEKGIGVSRFDTLANLQEVLFLNKEGINNHVAHYYASAYADENSIYVAGFQADYWDCADPDSIELYVIDTTLNQLAYKSLGGDISYDAFGVLTAKDGGAIIFGQALHGDNDYCNGNLVIYYINRNDLGLPPVKVYNEKIMQASTKVYPNPSSGLINIRIKNGLLTNNSRIKIFNQQGRKIYDYQLPETGNTIQLNITNLERGTYVYKITDENKVINSGKFIKQ